MTELLKRYIVVKSKGGPRPSESVETMVHRGDIQSHENHFESISNLCVNYWGKWWDSVDKQRLRGRDLDERRALRVLTGQSMMLSSLGS